MLQQLMGEVPLMTPPTENVAIGMGEIIDMTANYRNYPNAIGYTFLFFAQEMIRNGEIKLLEVNGVKPDRQAINDGSYPLAVPFYAVTAGSENPNVKPFLEWVAGSQGQRIVALTGYTPLQQAGATD